MASRWGEKLKDSGLGIGLAALGGWLWYAGGQDRYPKWVRRVGVAALVTLITAFKLASWSWWLLVIFMVAFGAYSLGYGIPDPTDDGSTIAQFWERWFPWQTRRLELLVATRATTGLAYGTVYLLAAAVGAGSLWVGCLALSASTVLVPVIAVIGEDVNDVRVEGGLLGSLIVGLALLVR